MNVKKYGTEIRNNMSVFINIMMAHKNGIVQLLAQSINKENNRKKVYLLIIN